MRAYIINLDRAKDRWSFVEQAFAHTQFELCRISAVDGKALPQPHPDYPEELYHRFHGRPTSPGATGCYLSHLKALEAFLATSDEHALVAEDDVLLGPDFESALGEAMRHAKHWDILRLTGLSNAQPAKVADLSKGYTLNVSFGRLKGTGAYVVNRKAARRWLDTLLPMRVPVDHAMDREWFQGLRAIYMQPFPASQTDHDFKSSIQMGKSLKLPKWKRWIYTYPYQAFNEITRWIFRALSYLRLKATMK
jgi:glycosyl transferase family 25